MKKLKLFIVTAAISLTMSMTAFAGQWVQDDIGWWYQNDNGTYPINGLKKIDMYWYYFGDTGYMKTGWYQFANGWFGFSDSGSCLNPGNYMGEPSGAPYKGWVSFSGSYEATLNGIANGSVVHYNGHYWTDPELYQEEIVYEHDVAPAELENRFSLADMDF